MWMDIRVAKTKALISFAVTAKLNCIFVFEYAKSRFSHDEAQLKPNHPGNLVLFYSCMDMEMLRKCLLMQISVYRAVEESIFTQPCCDKEENRRSYRTGISSKNSRR